MVSTRSVARTRLNQDPKNLLGNEDAWAVRMSLTRIIKSVSIGSNLKGMIAAWGAYQFDGGELS
ncbi:DNA polymerase [Salmonella phage 18-India]|nr:DNA polymerase [Salmonella phage 18-India]